MKMGNISAIGRPLDPDYGTSRAIAIITGVVFLAGVIVQILSGAGWLSGARWGLSAGLTVFLSWALCRELDPDHDLSAFGAAGLGLVGLILWGLPHLLTLFWMLLAVRTMNRTTGLHATVLDAVTLVALGGWLAFQRHWGYSVITAVAFLLDAHLAPALRRQLVFTGISASIAVGAGLWAPVSISSGARR